jgi:hypothetical protein
MSAPSRCQFFQVNEPPRSGRAEGSPLTHCQIVALDGCVGGQSSPQLMGPVSKQSIVVVTLPACEAIQCMHCRRGDEGLSGCQQRSARITMYDEHEQE